MQEDTGETPAEVAKAYTISRDVLDARHFWQEIDALDLIVPESAQIEALTALWHLQRNATRWLIIRPGDISVITRMVERDAGPMRALREALPRILPASAGEALKASAARWRSQGFPDPLAGSLASLPYLNYGLDIVEVAQERRLPVAEVGQVYFALLDALHGQWLMDSVERLPVDGRWHAQARGVLRDELQAQQRALVGKVLASGDAGAKVPELVPRWLARDDAALRYTLGMFADMRNLRSMDFATLSVAVRRLAHLAQAGVEAD